MYNLKIKEITLKNHRKILPKKINIIIGPNSSGKSKFLKEIADIFYNVSDEKYIIEDISINLPNSYKGFKDSYKLQEKIVEDSNKQLRLKVYRNYGSDNFYPFLQSDDFYNNINKDKKLFLEEFGSLFVNYLGTENRLTMVKKSNYIYDFSNPINFLTDLYNSLQNGNVKIFKDLYKYVKKLFKKDIFLDSSTNLRFFTF